MVYGILGLAIFVRFFGLDRSLLAGSMTMSLLILPVIIEPVVKRFLVKSPEMKSHSNELMKINNDETGESE